VTDGIFQDERIVFDDVNEDWKRFCLDTLQFAVPGLDEIPPLETSAESPS